MIGVTCSQCGRTFSLADDKAGKRGRCPCGSLVVVPAAVPVAATPPPLPRPEALPPVRADDDLYINTRDMSDGEPIRFYCEQCKKPFEGFTCPRCRSGSRSGAYGGCMFCRTSYRASRKRCPVCDVDANMQKANAPVNAEPDEIAKALACWQAGYEEAKANGYWFSMEQHLTHARLLRYAGHGDEAWRLLNQLMVKCGRDYKSIGRIHQLFAEHLGDEAAKGDRDSLRIASVFHALVADLHSSLELAQNKKKMPDIYKNIGDAPDEKWHTNEMKRRLRIIKRNKKGNAERLYAVLMDHWQRLPKIDNDALERDVAAIIQTEPEKSRTSTRSDV
jgi:hypothetical protein